MNSFESVITKTYGKRGKEWLISLPSIVQRLTPQWQLSDLELINNLSYHCVLTGWLDNQPIILKLGLDAPCLLKESTALETLSNYGAVKVLAKSNGALLLERILPGTSLKSFFPAQDFKATEIVCEVIKKLHQAPFPLENIFPHVSEWLMAISKEWPIPSYHLKKARHLRDNLMATMAKPVLLHTDLHHDNILQANSHWMVIDPHGAIGEPAYEVAAFIRNPIPELLAEENVADIITNRIITFSKILNFNPKRIHDWCFVQAVLAWIWSIEDGSNTEYYNKLIEIFDNLDI